MCGQHYGLSHARAIWLLFFKKKFVSLSPNSLTISHSRPSHTHNVSLTFPCLSRPTLHISYQSLEFIRDPSLPQSFSQPHLLDPLVALFVKSCKACFSQNLTTQSNSTSPWNYWSSATLFPLLVALKHHLPAPFASFFHLQPRTPNFSKRWEIFLQKLHLTFHASWNSSKSFLLNSIFHLNYFDIIMHIQILHLY